ncbi:sulfatase-like hydrolase/transferase [Thermodesulfobacteriota bacterium]
MQASRKIANGLGLGVTAGALASVYDGLYMLSHYTYVPGDFPVWLLLFNCAAWAVFGLLAGAALAVAARIIPALQNNPGLSWNLFFLLPFAALYGILGSLHYDRLALKQAFDGHLSFLWVAGVIAVSCLLFRKKSQPTSALPASLMAELAAIMGLFYFCSNLPDLISWLLRCLNVIDQFSPKTALQSDLAHWLVYGAGVAVILALWLLLGVRSLPRFVGMNLLIAAVSLAALFGFNRQWFTYDYTVSNTAPTGAAPDIPYVILLVLDTVRTDHLSVYGYHKTTPGLEQFSRDALVFESCIANSPWTVPSHASLFTGLSPAEHGSHEKLNSKIPYDCHPLSEEFVTLAELFQQQGYLTAGFVSNAVLRPILNFDQGFSIYDTDLYVSYYYNQNKFHPLLSLFGHLTGILPRYTQWYKPAKAINHNIYRFLDRAGTRPFFLFANYLDAHDPYRPPLSSDPDIPLGYPMRRGMSAAFQRMLYDGEISVLDHQLGLLFDRLKQSGIYDEALIVVTSDHGELFGEHGLFRHGQSLYEGASRVPLLIKLPNSRTTGRRLQNLTLSDLFATILELCSIQGPESVSGRAFGTESDAAVTEVYGKASGIIRAIYQGSYKLIKYTSNKESELYNLQHDPRELTNLLTLQPGTAAELDRKLELWRESHPRRTTATGNHTITTDQLNNLKALGYIQ